jgi:hypothetical protein
MARQLMTEPATPHATGRLSPFTLTVAIAGALLFLYLRTFILPATPLVAHDDQVLFFIRAARMVHGQVLYRDFFELVTPGIDLLYAAAFRLFGIHAWIMQAWSVVLGLAIFCVITLIARRMLRGPLILLPGLLFLVFDFNLALDPTHHWYSTLFALAAVAVLAGGASAQRILASGALCGIAALFTQTQGVLTFVALIIYLIWLKRSEASTPALLPRLAALAVPFALILFCVLGYYIHEAGFHTLFFDLVLFAPRYMSSSDFNSPQTYLHQIPPLHTPADLVRLIPVLFIYAVVPYIYLFGLLQLWRGRKTLPVALVQNLVLLHLVGFALFLAVANGPRLHRLCTVAPPAILICVWLISRPGRGWKITRNLLWFLATVLALLLVIYRQAQWHRTLDLPIGRTAFYDPVEFAEFQWLAQRTHPSDLLFNEGGLSLYLSLDNPTASEFVNHDEFTRPEQVTAVIQSLQHHPPHFIVLDQEDPNPSDPHDHSAPFRRYVHDHYRLAQSFSLDHGARDEEIWELNPNAAKQPG